MNVAGPDWQGRYVAARDQLRDQHAALVALIGRQLTAGWTGHDPVNGRWFQGLPVVLVFNHLDDTGISDGMGADVRRVRDLRP
ncbi:hypothetical protein Ahu01nite_070110 [Winogradskya humida]|uniref:Uncharacterized protein n=2 Tax=Winogradskya humida TaxID=113566 RepID=A0ABQ3ZZ72_9ACTN|nr:hypothetical protein Ahu01nite_070110 [Actinoplanes humidus]